MPRHFVRFLDGRAGKEISIAFLSGGMGRFLSTSTTDIRLSLEYAQKLNLKHRMTLEKFEFVQDAIDHGYCFEAMGRRLEFVYVRNDVATEIYCAVIKSAAPGNELWLVTFHRIQLAQLEKKRRALHMVRDHQEEFPE